MPLEFWLAMLAQLVVIIGAAIRLEHRITALERDVHWLTTRHGADTEQLHGPHRRT